MRNTSQANTAPVGNHVKSVNQANPKLSQGALCETTAAQVNIRMRSSKLNARFASTGKQLQSQDRLIVSCVQRDNIVTKEVLVNTVQLDISLLKTVLAVTNVRQANTAPMGSLVAITP